MSGKNLILCLSMTSIILSCNSKEKNFKSAIDSISENDLKTHIAILASDEFQGRAPSTIGEERTIRYLEEQFTKIGLQPGNGDSFFQEIPLVKISADKQMKFIIKSNKREYNLIFSEEFAGGTPQLSSEVSFDNSEVIFVGYGINAPEYNWNDYQGLDVKGKTVLMLVNDPGYATSDSTLFEGRTMTYYGRWTYKFEEAARQGAKAAIIIHETGAAAYPWGVVQGSWTGAKFYLADDMLSKSELYLQSWVNTECAKRLFEGSGLDYDSTVSSASVRGFKPVKMNMSASVKIENKVEYIKSNNVAALWPGKKISNEYLIYTAHWDHLGINPMFGEDSILNGALDNATGTAALLEIAQAFTTLAKREDISILFLAVTCEEQGLLGSEFYAQNPIYPLDKTVGVINMDGLNIFGRTKDMTIIGMGRSTLDGYAQSVLKKYGRYICPDPTPEKGGYFRSDHFSFAKVGVPTLYLSKGIDNLIEGKEWGLARSEKWIKENYHKPSDSYDPEIWDTKGMVEDVRVYFEIGYVIASPKDFTSGPVPTE